MSELTYRDKSLSTQFQKYLHVAKSKQDEFETVHCIFHDIHYTSTWYNQKLLKSEGKFDSIPTEDGVKKLLFELSCATYHGLNTTYIVQNFPEVSAVDGYEIKWQKNPALLFDKIDFLLNQSLIQSLDPIFCDFYNQFISSKDVDEDIGESKNEWKTCIQAFSTFYTLPFFYDRNPESFFPVYMCNAINKIVHSITSKSQNLSDMILIRRKIPKSFNAFRDLSVEDNYENIPFNNNLIICKTNSLPYPEVYSELVFLDENYIFSSRCDNYHKKMIIRNVKNFDSDLTKLKSSGESISITFESFNYPIFAIFWCLENFTSSYKFNYTSYDNISPIEWTTLGNVFNELSPIHTEKKHPQKHFTKKGKPGYNAWLFGVNISHSDINPGTILNGEKLTVKIRDNIEGQYRLRVRVMYYHNLEFKTFSQKEEDRGSSTELTTFEISGDT